MENLSLKLKKIGGYLIKVPGSVLLIPLLLIFFGPVWDIPRTSFPASVHLEGITEGQYYSREVRLNFVPEGTQWFRAVPLKKGEFLHIKLKDPVKGFSLRLQIDNNDRYEISASTDGINYKPLWTAEVKKQNTDNLSTVQSPFFHDNSGISDFMLTPSGGDGIYSVGGFLLEKNPVKIPGRIFALLIPAVFIILSFLPGSGLTGKLRSTIFKAWSASDSWLTALIIYLIFFEPGPSITAFMALFAVLAFLASLFRYTAKHHRPALISFSLTAAAVIFLVPPIADRIISHRLSYLHDTNLDHRLVPDGDEVNNDSLRYRGTPESFARADYRVMFMGDSYTYGYNLLYDDTFPVQFENMANNRNCSTRIAALNAGWVSSSPLLSLRLLQDIGPRYKPDLVVYTLDMTDFHDDLRYEINLRKQGDFRIDSTKLITHLLKKLFPDLAGSQGEDILPGRLRLKTPVNSDHGIDFELPDDRFFITGQPLEDTKPLIERGVIKYLEGINDFVTRNLNGRMVLVLVPRAYQYSSRESPDNWERANYQTLGPYCLEPFRYFQEYGDILPYPVIDLLPDFQYTELFPLFFTDDPHWNEEGAKFVAGLILENLEEKSLIPCQD